MPVMVELTLKIDAATYQAMHGQILPVARKAGMLFHSGREVEGGIGVVDFWPSADAWNAFSEGALAEGMKGAGVEMPDDLKVTPVLDADSR